MPSVDIVDYQDAWPAVYLCIADELRDVMADLAAGIEYIGSTAVPGLCAKPVLDILMGVSSLSDVEAELPSLARRGYRYRPEHEVHIPQRRYLVRDANHDSPRVHLHVVVLGARLWQDHLRFRDALRRDPVLAAQYAELKRELAVSKHLSKSSYTEAKAPFIRSVLERRRGEGGRAV